MLSWSGLYWGGPDGIGVFAFAQAQQWVQVFDQKAEEQAGDFLLPGRPYTATDVLAYSHADYLRQLEHDRAGRANKTRIAASYETIAGITGSTETPGS